MKNLTKTLAVLVTILMVSCGDEKKEQETITIGEEGTIEKIDTRDEDQTAADNVESGEAIQRQDGVVQINLTGDDMMKFNLNEIRVKAGETVRLTLTHVGQLPENAMGHNFVLLKQGTDVVDFGQRAATASGNDYIPEGTNNVIVHTEMIGGGEETTIEFTAPEAGTYDYICSFPGHYIQMQGKFIVE
ncbi:plastocyanin/azurin family copper-binding protein [Salinimicrobium terrae]|uniref:plastocyanin/azurin family copper-binding protein n=1 Tax=Salinimicrobium terrae TaxID=470866 RepID=UPI0003F900D4|nr:azurin [Salinimicrobium terrae]